VDNVLCKLECLDLLVGYVLQIINLVLWSFSLCCCKIGKLYNELLVRKSKRIKIIYTWDKTRTNHKYGLFW